MSKIDLLDRYFSLLRHSKNHHLGLGDIRLTLSQQKEILRLFEDIFEDSYHKGWFDGNNDII